MASAYRVASLLLLAAAAARASGLPWEIWETPARIAGLDARDRVLERSSHCPGGCRYDRSNAGSEGAVGNPYPLRWLYRDGDEAVLLDERGPGALTRLWVTTGFGTSTCIDPAVRIRIHVDDASTPVLDVPLAAMFDGSTPPFTLPLVADRMQSSGGYVSRVPIAHVQSLRIALVGADNGGTNPCTGTPQRLLWFQLQHHQLEPGTPVSSFTAGHDEPAWRSFLAHAGDDPWNAMLLPQAATTNIAAGDSVTLATRAGPGWLRGIRLHLPHSAYADVGLRVRIDGVTTIDLPLADFFATPVDAQVAPRGVLVGEDASGWLYAWFPQPFAATAEVDLTGGSALAGSISVDSALSFDTAPASVDVGHFDAHLVDACSATAALALDVASGAGRVVGVAARYRADGVVTRGYLEGDERATVDGAFAPAWYGTGVEDFYDGGFYFDHGAYAGPLSGASTVDADGSGNTSVYRLMPTDPVTWTSALRLVQEAGYAPDLPVPTCVRAVVYAYRAQQPSLVAYDGFEIGDVAAAAHAYTPSPSSTCVVLASQFEDEPPTSRSARACRFAAGTSHFNFHVADAVAPFRLRRTFDAGAGTPGEIAGSAAATIFVNGAAAGAFPPAPANPLRRWQQQEALLEVAPATTDFDIVVVPDVQAYAAAFGESRWELRGGWKDRIFADGFDAPSPHAAQAIVDRRRREEAHPRRASVISDAMIPRLPD